MRLRFALCVAVIVILCAACSAGSVRASPPPTSVAGHPPTYRWHSVDQSDSGEVSTIDGVADPQHHRYALHFRSSLGRASGGNMVVSDGRWFAEMALGVWCSDPGPAQEIPRTNEDLAHPSIDPIKWWSKLRDGESSPTIAMIRYMGISFNTRRPAKAVVHRHGDTLNVTFDSGPAPRVSVLTFSDFEHTPSVVIPTGTKPCPSKPSGD